jgi:hypothetical protein
VLKTKIKFYSDPINIEETPTGISMVYIGYKADRVEKLHSEDVGIGSISQVVVE